MVLGLGWWARALPDGGSPDFWMVVEEVQWLLQQLAGSSRTSTKRAHDGDEIDKDRHMKR